LGYALGLLSWLNKLRVDGNYTGPDFAAYVRNLRPKLEVEVVKRSTENSFEVLPKRWVVERTLAWLMQCRRLTRDYERTIRWAAG
jgi:transposase